MKNRAVGPALFHADGETGKYTGRQVGKRAGGQAGIPKLLCESA